VFRPGTAKYQELIVELLKMQRAKIDAAAAYRRCRLEQPQSAVRAGRAGAGLWRDLRLAAHHRHHRPLQEGVTAARRVASGDLTGHIDDSAKDETGQLLSALKDMNAACWAS
jgi:methyl-accepting chemotaxis protein